MSAVVVAIVLFSIVLGGLLGIRARALCMLCMCPATAHSALVLVFKHARKEFKRTV
jgi:hypothetical protein